MTHSPGKKIVNGMLGGLGLTVATAVVALVQLRLVVDFLPKEIAGIWLLFLGFGVYIAFFDLGVSPTLGREIGFALGAEGGESARRQRIANLLATCFRIFSVLAAAVFLLALLVGGFFVWHISPQQNHDELLVAWGIFCLGAAANLLGAAPLASLYGFGDVATERVVRSFTQFLGLGLAYLGLSFGWGIIGLASAWVVQNLLARTIAALVLHRRYSWLRQTHGKVQMAIFKQIAGPSLRWAAMGFGAILILQTDNIVIAATVGPQAIPMYEAVAKIAMMLMTFSLLIVSSSAPFLSLVHAAGQKEVFIATLLRNVRFSVSMMLILASFLAAFGDRVIAVWLGPENFVGFPVLWTLLVMVSLETHHVALATATMATGRIVFAWAALCAGLLNILLSVVLVRYLGLWGIALGTMIAQLLTNNWYAPYVTMKTFQIGLSVYFKTVLMPIFLLAMSLLAANYVLRELSADFLGWWAVSVPFLGSMLFGFIVAFWVVADGKERENLFRIVYSRHVITSRS